MSTPPEINTVPEWLRLPELPLRTITSERETGSVYRVLRVNWYAASEDDRFFLRELFGRADLAHGSLSLPSIVVEQHGLQQMYRLPTSLSGWAVDVAAHGIAGLLTFPIDVEFGVLMGRPYAEFVL